MNEKELMNAIALSNMETEAKAEMIELIQKESEKEDPNGFFFSNGKSPIRDVFGGMFSEEKEEDE